MGRGLLGQHAVVAVEQELGKGKGTLAPVVNNGGIVTLDGASTWTVTGECLAIASGSEGFGPGNRLFSAGILSEGFTGS